MTAPATSAAATNMQVFEKFPDKGFTGVVPIFFETIAIAGGKTYAKFNLLHSNCLKSAQDSFETAFSEVRIGSVRYEQGAVKTIFIFKDWVDNFTQRGATSFILCQSNSEYSILDKGINVKELSSNAYNNMALMCAPLMGIQLVLSE